MKMTAGIAPCRGCTEREIGCHGKCEKYIQWQADLELVKAPYKRAMHNEINSRTRVKDMKIRRKRP